MFFNTFEAAIEYYNRQRALNIQVGYPSLCIERFVRGQWIPDYRYHVTVPR